MFELTSTVSIGRDADNTLRIKQLSVSRHHCLLEKQNDRVKIVDRSSFGTFVNHLPIKERFLEHGDEITIGDSLLVFLCDEDRKSLNMTSTQMDRGDAVTLSAVRLRREEVFYLQPEHLPESFQPTARVTRDLTVLLKISALISSALDMETLQNRLLDSVLELIPAEYGVILQATDGDEKYTASVSRCRRGDAMELAHISRAVVDQVSEQGVAILSNELLEGPAVASDERPSASRSHWLLCAPLASNETVTRMLYLVSESRGVPYEEKHLELLTAIASIASIAIENVQHIEDLKAENRRLAQEISLNSNMIGDSPAMHEVYRLIGKVAPTDSTVLIRGESGTGKELAAYAIHANSPRADKPFFAINCASLTEQLLESELFGHEKGAFTGACAQKKGKLELAHGGTFFLDEIGEINPSLQAKLLRVLQNRVFERVGGNRQIKVNVRLIAATNKNLEEALRAGSFREDLYYRLNVVELVLPPLRARREDIPLLANYFAVKHGERCKRRVLGVSSEVHERLMSYDWRGNVRELENAIEHAVVLGSTEQIMLEDLPPAISKLERSAQTGISSFKKSVEEHKKFLILNALERANGSYVDAAALLDMHPNNLHRLIRTLNLKSEL